MKEQKKKEQNSGDKNPKKFQKNRNIKERDEKTK